jgi:hypothetical protein
VGCFVIAKEAGEFLMSMITPLGGWDADKGTLAFCASCGKEVTAENRFCTGCGVAYPVQQLTPQQLAPWIAKPPPGAFVTQSVPQQYITQQVTIVQAGTQGYSSGGWGCLFLLILLCLPLWPIMIPLLIPLLIVCAVVCVIIRICTPRPPPITYRIDGGGP